VSCPSQRTTALPCLLLNIKDSLKEDVGHFGHCFEAFASGFWLSDGEGFLDMRGFWKRRCWMEIAEGGKRMAERRLLK
jgi:hypothetical protein